jgi:voltage-gated potassium channel
VLIVEADATGGWHTAAVVANWIIWAVFAADFALILSSARNRLESLRAHWLDGALVILTVPAFGALLSSLRFVRLVRLLRVVRAAVLMWRAIQAERNVTSGAAFRFVAIITVFIVVVAGSAEATFDSHDFPSVWSGVWWAIVTVTTVGYGDLYPRSVSGRIIGILVMFVGIGFLSILTATVASAFVKSDTASSEIHASLQRIERELADLRAQLGATERA